MPPVPFASLQIPDAPQFWLRGARVPACLLAAPVAGVAADPDGALLLDLHLADGRVTEIRPAGGEGGVDLGGRHVWPALIDMHTHLDKGHTIPRAQNRDGSFEGAIEGVKADRPRYWTAEDVTRRMRFALRCAHAHGVAAIRTHIDSYEPQAPISWGAFRALRDEWAGRIELQAAALVSIDLYREPWGVGLANLVADSGGILGAVTRDGTAPDGAGGHGDLMPDTDDLLDRVFAIAIVTLPTVNMYLQDRHPDRTPRRRGATLVHEMRAAGVPVAVAGDNCRDPFHAYGDHDMVDTFRQAVRILHLDHPIGDAPALVGPAPAGIIGAGPLGSIGVGGPAKLTLFNARTLNELMSRPQADRIVLDRGRRVTDGLPDYAELDGA
jgi:cytosine deaminase